VGLTLVFAQGRFNKNNGVDGRGLAGVLPDPGRDLGFAIGETKGKVVFAIATLTDAALPDNEGAAEGLPQQGCI